jgi:ketol-acid reductoisomerase
MPKIWTGPDVTANGIDEKRVAVLGFGNQGHAHALNLRDQGVAVSVGARKGKGWDAALSNGFAPLTISEACKQCQVLMMALPDEHMADIYSESIAPYLDSTKTLMVCHGFAFHFGLIDPPKDVDVCLAAPKGSGASMRREFEAGRSLAGLVAVHKDASGNALQTALGYAWGLGFGRSVVIETTFKEECVTDLFGEQTVLCGGIPELIKAAFATLVDAGYSPEAAYLECLHEAKLITDLLYERGLTGMREAISDTAEWGGYKTGTNLIDERVRQAMRETLKNIEDGDFAREWVEEARNGKPTLKRLRKEESGLQIEKTGDELRPILLPKDYL